MTFRVPKLTDPRTPHTVVFLVALAPLQPLASSASGSHRRPNLADSHGCRIGLRPWTRCGTHSGPALDRRPILTACSFLWNEAGFSPASYSQTLGKLREFLVKSGIPAGQAQQYTLHSLKTTFLSCMSQLSILLSARFLQGHHKPPGSAQLYSRALGTTCGPHSAHNCFCGEQCTQAFVQPALNIAEARHHLQNRRSR